MDQTPHVGVGVIVTRDSRVLLLKRANVHGDGTWSTPGGHLEWGESPEVCAAREVKEETGIDVASVQFIGITNDVFEALGRHYVTLWMKGCYLSGEPAVNAPDEMCQVGWFAWDNLPQPLFLCLQNLLDGKCYPPDAVAGIAR